MGTNDPPLFAKMVLETSLKPMGKNWGGGGVVAYLQRSRGRGEKFFGGAPTFIALATPCMGAIALPPFC